MTRPSHYPEYPHVPRNNKTNIDRSEEVREKNN